MRKYIGAYFAELGGTDGIVFTGGIGENSPTIRERICRGLECIGLVLDTQRNRNPDATIKNEISAEGSKLRAFVIPTDEELLIARDTVRVVRNAPRRW